MHQPIQQENVFVVGRDHAGVASVLECEAHDFHGHISYHCVGDLCPVTLDAIRTVFKTKEEAQKEFDTLTSYIEYRMSGHKK